MVLRLALANLHRPGAPTARVVLSLGIGLTVLVAVALVQASLSDEIEDSLAEGAPAYFFLDIQPGQVAGFEVMVRAIPGARMEEVPMLRGRITQLNGVPVENAAVASDARWALNSDRGLTYAADPPKGSEIVAGQWWPADYHGPPLVSFDAGLARGMGLKVGDTLTVNVLGREVTATIASLRSIEWTRLGINFAIVFAPGTLEAAPHTVLAATWLPPGTEERLVGQIVDQDPNVSAIPVREALDAVERIIVAIGAAIRLAALVTLVAGALVLGGAIAADYRRRVYEAVVLKVLGATRRTIAAAFLVEYGLMGLVGAALAAGLGTLIAYLLVTGPLRADWSFAPWPLVVVLAAAVALTMALGFAGTWRVLGAPAAAELRHE
jgi:putative ABC transport system permease protein